MGRYSLNSMTQGKHISVNETLSDPNHALAKRPVDAAGTNVGSREQGKEGRSWL